ncbi:MAG: hypothetical protein ACM3ML_24665 [Micromonosporaceae bacterium]
MTTFAATNPAELEAQRPTSHSSFLLDEQHVVVRSKGSESCWARRLPGLKVISVRVVGLT